MTERVDKCWKEIGVWGDASCPTIGTVGHCRHCPRYVEAGRALFERAVPPGYRDEWTELFKVGKGEQDSDTLSVLAFRIGEEWLALKTVCFREATDMAPIRTVPLRSNHVFLGLVNVHGELLPCVSLGALLDLTPPAADSSGEALGDNAFRWLLVVGSGQDRYSFPVHGIDGVLRVATEDLLPPPATLSKFAGAIVQDLFRLRERTVGLLDSEKLFHALQGSLAQ